MREATEKRTSNETDISVKLNLDGTGRYEINTGCGFLDHMLELFSRHGRFDLTLSCKGDIKVDAHHTVEDTAIVLGSAFSKALGERKGIARYGSAVIPMDEALVMAVSDISGRAFVENALLIPTEKVGEFDTELVNEFFWGFSRSLGATVHLRQLSGKNSHHIIEAAFKAFARSLAASVAIEERYKDEIPSTKGIID